MRGRRWWVLAAALAAVGCLGAESAADLPVGSEGWHVREGDFYHSFEARGDTWADEFDWENPLDQARVEVRHALRGGHEVISVVDAAGNVVWSQEFRQGTPNGAFWTGKGEPGAWQVRLERFDAYGQVDVHVWRVTE